MTRRRIVIALVSLAAVVGFAGLVVHRLNALPRDAVLRYGDTVVTQGDLDRRVAVLKAVYGVERPPRGAALDRFNRDAAKSYAVSLVLDHVAAEHGIKVAESAASRELSSMVDKTLGGDEDAFVDFLAAAGVNRVDVVTEVRRTIAARRLYAQVTDGVDDASVADAKRTFTERKARMKTPEQRTLRTIVVASEADAAQIRQRLDDGADFAALAREASQDSVSGPDGGLLGTLPRSALDMSFGTAAFRAKEGEVFGPIHSQHGWNVGRVDEVIAPRALGFPDVRDALVQELTAQRLAAVWNPWLHDQLRAADIDYADAYRPKDPYAPGPGPAGTVPGKR